MPIWWKIQSITSRCLLPHWLANSLFRMFSSVDRFGQLFGGVGQPFPEARGIKEFLSKGRIAPDVAMLFSSNRTLQSGSSEGFSSHSLQGY